VGVLTVIYPTGANINVDRSVLIDAVSCLQFVSKWDSYSINNRLTSLSDVCLEIICQLLCACSRWLLYLNSKHTYSLAHSHYTGCNIDENWYPHVLETSELYSLVSLCPDIY